MTKGPKRLDLSLYFSREPVTLALLTGLALVLLLAVTGLSRLYHAQQESLAERWSGRGVDDLNAGHFQPAVMDFRTALLYDRDNSAYQLSLAQALLGLKRTDEAYAYLINLWDRQPENGVVNLELARIAVQKGQTERALRFYHNAIYATWPGNQETERRKARLELINYLLQINARTQAESELIALEANAGEDAAQQARLGGLFLRVQDYSRALPAFRESLKLEPKNDSARAGAGIAAFETGQFPLAERYLAQAVASAPNDTASATLLQTTDLVLKMDPFRPQLSDAERNRVVVNAFNAAGDRLKACPALGTAKPAPVSPGSPPAGNAAGNVNTNPSNSSPSSLAQQWEKLKPQITERGLRQDPDLVNAAMNLSFQIERGTTAACGPGSQADKALLLIANLHEES
ncbi:MAG TPA: tetratricopeptide repeat protein [Terracidiphilus sp.]|jgi:tetratricopeptide (TPR) repeat protein